MDAKDLPGSIKAAILIQSAGNVISGKIFKRLNEEERQLVRDHLSQMGDISPDLVEKVAEEFIQLSERMRTPQIDSPPVPETGGPKDAPSPASSKPPSDLLALKTLAPDHLLDLVREEHPQTIAMILVHVKQEVASVVMANLSDEIKADVGYRIATLDKVGAGMIDEIGRIFDDVLRDNEDFVSHVRGGAGVMADILNQIDATSREVILDAIDKTNPKLAEQIKQRMFTFEDLILVDNKGLQKVLRRVESKELALSLKGASEEVKEKIFSNMSERAAEMVREEIEVLGAVRMKEVEDARRLITRIIQELEDQGELIIAGRKGEELIV